MEFEFTSNFDSHSFRRDLEKAAKDSVKQSVQPMLDRLSRVCNGKPVDEVKRRLASEWKRVTGGRITDPDLTGWAIQLAEGGRIVMK